MDKIIEEINDLVVSGKLPIAFKDLVFEETSTSSHSKHIEKVHKPYMQRNICNADASCLVTKIFDVF